MESRDEVGSSIMISLESQDTALMISTICTCASVSSFILVVAVYGTSNLARTSSHRLFCAFLSKRKPFVFSLFKNMLSATVR